MDGQKSDETPVPAQFAPGDTIRPQQTQTAPPAPDPAKETVTAAQPPQMARSAALPPVEAVQAAKPDGVALTPQPAEADTSLPANPEYAEMDGEAITWTASEFIAHHKTGGWYALLWLAVVAGSVLVWVLTKDIISSVVVVVAGGLLATYASHKPRQISYQIDPSGLTIAQRHYEFNDFRSFYVVPEGAFSSIVFTPLKRFGTLTTIYYDPKDEQQIIDLISQRLPQEEPRRDMVESVMRRIRF